jgi:hypothetical protein
MKMEEKINKELEFMKVLKNWQVEPTEIRFDSTSEQNFWYAEPFLVTTMVDSPQFGIP